MTLYFANAVIIKHETTAHLIDILKVINIKEIVIQVVGFRAIYVLKRFHRLNLYVIRQTE